jgi:hypothetical protein
VVGVSGIVEFLRARLAEDEEAARAATEGPWFADHPEPKHWGDDPESALLVRGKVLCILDNQYGGPLNVDHIVRHDPTRVLAENEAKRKIIDWYEVADASFELHRDAWQIMRQVLLLLAVPFAAHPDYDERWKP